MPDSTAPALDDDMIETVNRLERQITVMPTLFSMRIMLIPPPPREKTKGGILIPEQAKRDEKIETAQGKLVAMGYTAYSALGLGMHKRNPLPPEQHPQLGDWVMIGRSAGQWVTYCGVNCLIVTDESVLFWNHDPRQLKAYIPTVLDYKPSEEEASAKPSTEDYSPSAGGLLMPNA